MSPQPCRVEWKETARWVKFEEDVEEGGNKWSKPHVATLSLHSLFELRSCILKGTVLLDLEASDLGQIAGGFITTSSYAFRVGLLGHKGAAGNWRNPTVEKTWPTIVAQMLGWEVGRGYLTMTDHHQLLSILLNSLSH